MVYTILIRASHLLVPFQLRVRLMYLQFRVHRHRVLLVSILVLETPFSLHRHLQGGVVLSVKIWVTSKGIVPAF